MLSPSDQDVTALESGRINLHGAAHSIVLVTPDVLFTGLRALVQKVLVAFDIAAHSNDSPDELLQTFSREVARDLLELEMLTSRRFLTSVMWLWLHALLRAEVQWLGILDELSSSRSASSSRRAVKKWEMKEDLKALRAMACFACV